MFFGTSSRCSVCAADWQDQRWGTFGRLWLSRLTIAVNLLLTLSMPILQKQSRGKRRVPSWWLSYASEVSGSCPTGNCDLRAYHNTLRGGSIVKPPIQVNVQGTLWVDTTLLSSEVPDYYTRYMATVKDDVAVLYTFSVHKSSGTRTLAALSRLSFKPFRSNRIHGKQK